MTRVLGRVAAIASIAAIAAAPALADSPVLPQTDARPVQVYCDGANDWARLAAEQGFDPNTFSSWVV